MGKRWGSEEKIRKVTKGGATEYLTQGVQGSPGVRRARHQEG